MKRQKTKIVTMLVMVRVPAFLSAAQARREVRTLINEQSGFLSTAPITKRSSRRRFLFAPSRAPLQRRTDHDRTHKTHLPELRRR
ncbi:hypothetical protein SAMN06265338_1364 [Rhodoblastus acidophilus]|uniref:Secreted protein n=1 Tax=Rhodoblastus acidophilus TaxID=1074 RepID=A0A212SFH1_RHOAC|nr:hypothetical protein SAMN06265338_1364 [Rhodoblastus acidophilus]